MTCISNTKSCLDTPISKGICLVLHTIPTGIIVAGILAVLCKQEILSLAGLSAMSQAGAIGLLAVGVACGILQIAFVCLCKRAAGDMSTLLPASRPQVMRQRLIKLKNNIYQINQGKGFFELNREDIQEMLRKAVLDAFEGKDEERPLNLKKSREQFKSIPVPPQATFGEPLSLLPIEIVQREVCKHLQSDDIRNLSQVCKRGYQVISNDANLQYRRLHDHIDASSYVLLRMTWIAFGCSESRQGGGWARIWLRPDGSLLSIVAHDQRMVYFDPKDQKLYEKSYECDLLEGAYSFDVRYANYKEGHTVKQYIRIEPDNLMMRDMSEQIPYPKKALEMAKRMEKDIDKIVRKKIEKCPKEQLATRFFTPYPWCLFKQLSD